MSYILVGAGGSGAVVAGRLSETGASVLVLEAGGSAAAESMMPGMAGTLIGQENDWKLPETVSSDIAQGFDLTVS